MSTMTPAQVAARLRILADLLDLTACPAPLRLYVSLNVPEGSPGLDESGRVTALAAVTAALGMAAAPTKTLAGWWERMAIEDGPGFTVRASTHITSPRICVCGQECTHDSRQTAAG